MSSSSPNEGDSFIFLKCKVCEVYVQFRYKNVKDLALGKEHLVIFNIESKGKGERVVEVKLS